MRPLMIVLVVFALAIAGVTAYLARTFVSQPAPQATAPAQPTIPTEKVLVAARDIRQGAVVVDEDLRYETWPAGAVDAQFILQSVGDDARAKVVGGVAARHITAGEPLRGAAVFRQDESGHLSGMLGPGMRAISIAITPDKAVSGFVTPGDRVDVLFVAKFKDRDKNEKERAEDNLWVSEVLLRDVRVLAIDNNMNSGVAAVPGKTATLEVTPRDAESLILAGLSGSLHLVLRSQTMAESLDTEGLFDNVSASKAMQTYSDLAGKMGFAAGKKKGEGEDAVPSLPVGGLDGAEAVDGRKVKLNRAGIIDIRTFPN